MSENCYFFLINNKASYPKNIKAPPSTSFHVSQTQFHCVKKIISSHKRKIFHAMKMKFCYKVIRSFFCSSSTFMWQHNKWGHDIFKRTERETDSKSRLWASIGFMTLFALLHDVKILPFLTKDWVYLNENLFFWITFN